MIAENIKMLIFTPLLVVAFLQRGEALNKGTYQVVAPGPFCNDLSVSLYTTGTDQVNVNQIPHMVDRSFNTTNKIKFDPKIQDALHLQGNHHTLELFPKYITPRVRMHCDEEEAGDGYLPLSSDFLGNEYTVSSWKPSGNGQSFVSMTTSQSATKVMIVFPKTFNRSMPLYLSGEEVFAKDTLVLWIPPYSARTLASRVLSLDGVLIKSSKPIGVHSGSVGKEDDQSYNLIEMIPPTKSLGEEYVVAMPYGIDYSVIKVISTQQGVNTRVIAVTNSKDGDVSTRYNMTLNDVISTWSHDHVQPLVIQSTKPVLVVQYLMLRGRSNPVAMTFVPTISSWVNSYHVLPVVSKDESTVKATHTAQIIAREEDISGLMGTSLEDATDVTSELAWREMGSSGFSEATIDLLNSQVVWLRHLDPTVTFQIILSGVNPTTGKGYALPGLIATLEQGRQARAQFRKKREVSRVAKRNMRYKRNVVVSTPSVVSTTAAANVTNTGVSAAVIAGAATAAVGGAAAVAAASVAVGLGVAKGGAVAAAATGTAATGATAAATATGAAGAAASTGATASGTTAAGVVATSHGASMAPAATNMAAVAAV